MLTKCDLVPRNDVARRIMQIRDSFDEILPGLGNMLPIVATSSSERKGFIDLKKQLASLAVEADYSLAMKIQNEERERWLKAKAKAEERKEGGVKVAETKEVSKISSVIKSVSVRKNRNLNFRGKHGTLNESSEDST